MVKKKDNSNIMEEKRFVMVKSPKRSFRYNSEEIQNQLIEQQIRYQEACQNAPPGTIVIQSCHYGFSKKD